MSSKPTLLFILFSLIYSATFSQITPEAMITSMGRGINAGNVMSAPEEGNWAPAFTANYFNDIKEAGFKTVRIPIDFFGVRTSGDTSVYSSAAGSATSYTGTPADYVIDPTYLDRVEQVITWALERDLITILDFHGGTLKEEFLDTFDQSYAPTLYTHPTSAKRAADNEKFRAIWTQIATRFKDYSYNLAFEVVNEPYFRMTASEMDSLNTDIINIIRATGSNNTDRNIIITGGGQNSYEAPLQIGASVLALDDNLIATFHYYWPRAFTASASASQNDFDWGTTADKAEIDTNFSAVQSWAIANTIPILLGEFGADNTLGKDYDTAYPYTNGADGGPDNTSRVEYYRYLAQKAIDLGFALTAWDAGHKSGKSIYLVEDENGNEKRTWVQDVKNAVLGKTCDDTGLIKNADVECGITTNWSLTTNGATASLNDSGTAAFSGDHGIEINVTAAGSGYNKVVLLNENFTEDLSGKTITFRVFAKASTSSQSFKFQLNVTTNGVTSYPASDAIALTTNYQPYSFTYVVPENTTQLRFKTLCGKDGGIYYFDDFYADYNHAFLEYSGGNWAPTTPSVYTGSSDALIADGSYVINTDVQLNTLIVFAGADLTLDSGTTLNTNQITLNSTSTSYSSLIQNGTLTGTVRYNRFTAIHPTNDLVSPPLSGENFGNFASNNANLYANPSTSTEKLFGPFNNNLDDYTNWDSIADATQTLVSGVGYRTASVDGSTLQFTGTVPNTSINRPITVGTDPTFGKWNLIGNPFPSYINFQSFLSSNSTQLDPSYKAVYGYDGDASNGSIWTIWNLANTSTSTLITPGQGFFVVSKSGGGSITFDTSLRTTGTTDDFINGDAAATNSALALLELDTSGTTYTTSLYFIDDNTKGLDAGYDAGTYGGSETGIYSHLVEDNEGLPMAIQTLGYTDFNNVTIPLGIKANAGEQVRFSLGSSSTLPSSIYVYLEDNTTQTWTLLNTSDYVFTTGSTLTGIGRFFIHFSANALSDVEERLNSVVIYTPKNAKSIVVKGEIPNNTSIQVLDIQGRLVIDKLLNSRVRSQRISTHDLQSGIYIIQLKGEHFSKTLKTMLH